MRSELLVIVCTCTLWCNLIWLAQPSQSIIWGISYAYQIESAHIYLLTEFKKKQLMVHGMCVSNFAYTMHKSATDITDLWDYVSFVHLS